MIKHLFILSALIISIKCYSQYEWFNEYSGSSYVSISKLASDQNGNLFSVGNFESTVTLGNTTYQGGGAFLIKLNRAGEFVWARRFTYATLDFFGLVQVRTDQSGNVYTTGQYPRSANIGGVNISGDVHNSFLAKFNNDGQLLWIKTFIGLQEIFYISVNAQGDIGISGVFYAPALNIDAITLTTPNTFASFGAYFNTDGAVQWAQVFSSHNTFADFPMAITLDNDGNYYINHRFSASFTVGNSQFSSTATSNLFIIKINALGQLVWYKEITRPTPFSGNTELGELAVDANGDLYACGQFWTAFQVDDITITSSANSVFTSNSFIGKFSSADGTIAWVTPLRGELNGYTAENILVKHDRVYVSGLVESHPYFQTLQASNGQAQNGQEPKVFSLMGDIGNGLQVDSEGMIYLSGRGRNPDMKGYIFKYNTVGEITTEPEICVSQSLQATVTPILNADKYEWEVTYNSTLYWFETDEPTFEITAPDLVDITELSIRVRGKNDLRTSPFTSAKSVTIINPPEPPLIKSNCRSIELVRGNNVTWYTEEGGRLGYPPNTTAIKGEYDVTYFVVESTACGNQQSDPVKFQPFFFPNVITPNGDTKNETLQLDERLMGATVAVYDRWGKRVFVTDNYRNNWTGDNLATGVYFFTVEHRCISDTYKSPLSIIK